VTPFHPRGLNLNKLNRPNKPKKPKKPMPFHPKDNGLGNSRNQTNKIVGLQDLTPNLKPKKLERQGRPK
jgi:hypothetical protein